MSNRAAWVTHKNSRPLVVKSAPYPTPQAHEIVIKTAAVAANPVDWVLQLIGSMVFSWITYPAIFGSDMAGQVAEVGSAVTRFAVGDRVLALAVGLDPDSNNPAEGAFQHYAIAQENLVSHIPADLSYEHAAVLPLGLATAASSLFLEDYLNLRWPKFPPEAKTGKSVLIWGGSTSVGSNAVQLAAAAGYEVFSTSSPRNFDYVRKLGASQVFDYNSQTVVPDLIDALKTKDVAGAMAIGEGSVGLCIDVLSKTKGTKFVAEIGGVSLPKEGSLGFLTISQLMLGMAATNVSLRIKKMRTGVSGKFVWGSGLKKTELGNAIFRDFLPKALAEKKYLAAPEPEVVGHGLEELQHALDLQRRGVSARKLVVQL